MKSFENNIYAQKLEEYLNNTDKNHHDKKYYQQLVVKANRLRNKKSLELIKFLNTTKKLPLEKACSKIDKLLRDGADINFTFNGYEITPYMIASLNGHYELLDYLKERGADVLKQNTLGQNALMLVLIKRMTVSDIETKRIYLNTVKKLKEHKLDACLYTDTLGTTINDYYLSQFGKFTDFYKNLLDKFTSISNCNEYKEFTFCIHK